MPSAKENTSFFNDLRDGGVEFFLFLAVYPAVRELTAFSFRYYLLWQCAWYFAFRPVLMPIVRHLIFSRSSPSDSDNTEHDISLAHQVWLLKTSKENQTALIVEKNEAIADLQHRNNTLKSQVRTLERKMKALQKGDTSKRKTIKDTRHQLEQLIREKNNAENSAENSKQSIVTLNKKIDILRNERFDIISQRNQSIAEHSVMIQKYTNLQTEHDYLTQEAGALKTQLVLQKTYSIALTERISAIEHILTSKDNKITALKNEHSTASKKLKHLEQEVLQLKNANAALNGQYFQIVEAAEHQSRTQKQHTLFWQTKNRVLNQALLEQEKKIQNAHHHQQFYLEKYAFHQRLIAHMHLPKAQANQHGIFFHVPLPLDISLDAILDEHTIIVGSFLLYLLYRHCGVEIPGYDSVDIDLLTRNTPQKWEAHYTPEPMSVSKLWSHQELLGAKARYMNRDVDMVFVDSDLGQSMTAWAQNDTTHRPDHSLASFYGWIEDNILIIYDPSCEGTLSLLTGMVRAINFNHPSKERLNPIRILRLMYASTKFHMAIEPETQESIHHYLQIHPVLPTDLQAWMTRKHQYYQRSCIGNAYLKKLESCGLFKWLEVNQISEDVQASSSEVTSSPGC